MTEPEHRLQAAMAQLVGDDVADLVAAARMEARERVHTLLVDAMTEAMLDRARALGVAARTGGGPAARAGEGPAARAGLPVRESAAAPRAEQTAGPEQTASPEQTLTGFYIYCVVRADTEIPAGLDGIDPLHSPVLIRHNRLAAVVSRVPLADFEADQLRDRLSDMEQLERTARTHEQVLDTIGKRTTLIPMRLCSVYRNERGVIDMLWREASALQDALDHLEGKSEWGVKVFAHAHAHAHPHADVDPHAHAHGNGNGNVGAPDRAESSESPPDTGTDYMRRRQNARDHRRDADQQFRAACVTIHERLAELASAALTSPPQRPEVSGHRGEMLLNGVYLIENEQRDAFLDLVHTLHVEYATEGLELQPSGPWPAYNFVPSTIGAAW